MENDILKYLRNDDWTGAAKVYYQDAEETLAYLAANGEPMNNYRLSNSSSSQEEDESDGLFAKLLGILAAIGIPAGVAGAKAGASLVSMGLARGPTPAGARRPRG